LALAITELRAQQDPHYTQYMYNMSVMNPAYAGSKESMSGGFLYRKQWVEIEGAPTTGTFFIHSPVGRNVGLGLSVISDKIGPVEENNFYADFSYTLNLGGEHKLAFGLKGGLTMHKIDFNFISTTLPDQDPSDPFFSGNPNNTFLNIGSGVFYYTDKYYVAFSVPNMLKSKYLDEFKKHLYADEMFLSIVYNKNTFKNEVITYANWKYSENKYKEYKKLYYEYKEKNANKAEYYKKLSEDVGKHPKIYNKIEPEVLKSKAFFARKFTKINS
jgi:type IX secretion system PorP/SprF family membrane protein